MKHIMVMALIMCLSFALQAQVAVFYFPAQSAELSAEQVDSIETLSSSGVEITLVVGVANCLRNSRTSQANIDLAADRAEAALTALEIYTLTETAVIRSSSALDRRVEIHYQVVDSIEPTVDDSTALGTFVVSDSTESTFNSLTDSVAVDTAEFAGAVDSSTTTGVNTDSLMAVIDSLQAALDSCQQVETTVDTTVSADTDTTDCNCGPEMDRGYAVYFYFQVVDSATTVLKAMHASKGAVKDSLRTQFRSLRKKANGVRNCIRKSRRLAKKQDKSIRFIPITRKFAEKYGQAGPDCTADDIKSGEKATKKAVKRKKRRKGRFSFRRHRKPKAFKHSRWKAFLSRMACRGM